MPEVSSIFKVGVVRKKKSGPMPKRAWPRLKKRPEWPEEEEAAAKAAAKEAAAAAKRSRMGAPMTPVPKMPQLPRMPRPC